MNNISRKIYFLFILFLLTTIEISTQENVLDTISGKVTDINIIDDEDGGKILLLTIENLKKETEKISMPGDIKVLIYETSEVTYESIKTGSNVAIGYNVDPKWGKIAVWVYLDEKKKEERKEELKEEEDTDQVSEEEAEKEVKTEREEGENE
ncbi:MAG: hypothetical protein AB1498_09735 [bacterium]